MVANRIHQQVDRIAELLAFVATYDAETLENLQSWFDEISRLARETSQPEVAVVATAAAKVAERLSMEEEEPNFITSRMNQEGGAVLEGHPESDRQQIIREQLLTELASMAVSFRAGGEDGAEQDASLDEYIFAEV